MEKAGIAYSISLEFGQTEAIKNGVASGLVVSCLSLVAVQLELEYGLLMEVTSTLIPEHPLSLPRHRESHCTAFWQHLWNYQKGGGQHNAGLTQVHTKNAG